MTPTERWEYLKAHRAQLWRETKSIVKGCGVMLLGWVYLTGLYFMFVVIFVWWEGREIWTDLKEGH